MKYKRELLIDAQVQDLAELYHQWCKDPNHSGDWEDFTNYVRISKTTTSGFPKWKALRFINKNYGTRWARKYNGRFSVENSEHMYNSPESYMLDCGIYTLTEVERVKDGMVFKLGNVVTLRNRDERFRIVDIHPSKYNPGVYFNLVSLSGLNSYDGAPIDMLTLSEKLFTTDDEVDIYDGDKYWENYTGEDPCVIGSYGEYTAVADGDEDYNSPFRCSNLKRFSTEAALEQYCLMNARVLCAADFVSDTPGAKCLSRDKILSIVKSRI